MGVQLVLAKLFHGGSDGINESASSTATVETRTLELNVLPHITPLVGRRVMRNFARCENRWDGGATTLVLLFI